MVVPCVRYGAVVLRGGESTVQRHGVEDGERELFETGAPMVRSPSNASMAHDTKHRMQARASPIV